ncbi:MAG: hypothetical protein ACRDSJ_02135 [Rubrobacteraceae bacterium]
MTASPAPITTRRITPMTRRRLAYLLMTWAIITPSGKMSRGDAPAYRCEEAL